MVVHCPDVKLAIKTRIKQQYSQKRAKEMKQTACSKEIRLGIKSNHITDLKGKYGRDTKFTPLSKSSKQKLKLVVFLKLCEAWPSSL